VLVSRSFPSPGRLIFGDGVGREGIAGRDAQPEWGLVVEVGGHDLGRGALMLGNGVGQEDIGSFSFSQG